MVEIIIEEIDIPIEADNINLKASIYHTSNTPSSAPWIIMCMGLLLHRKNKFVKSFSERFANAGYYVLSFDYRGHGESKEETRRFNFFKTTPKVFADIHEIVTWVLSTQSNRLLEDKIILFGRSYGGAITLTHGFIDERVKILISLCARYDYSTLHIKVPQDLIEKMSPKYFLKNLEHNNDRILIAHCKDDDQIPFNNVVQIQDHLELNDENVLVFEEGGHSFESHRDEIFEKSLQFIQKL